MMSNAKERSKSMSTAARILLHVRMTTVGSLARG